MGGLDFLDPHVRRVPDYHVKADKIAVVIQHFGKFKSPFESVFKDFVGFYGLDAVFQFLDFGGQGFLPFFGFVGVGFVVVYRVVFFEDRRGDEQRVFVLQLLEFLDLGVVPGNLAPEIRFDIGDEAFHFAFLLPIFGVPVRIHGGSVAVNGPLAFFEGLFEVGIQGKPADQGVAAFYVDVNIGKGFQSP